MQQTNKQTNKCYLCSSSPGHGGKQEACLPLEVVTVWEGEGTSSNNFRDAFGVTVLPGSRSLHCKEGWCTSRGRPYRFLFHLTLKNKDIYCFIWPWGKIFLVSFDLEGEMSYIGPLQCQWLYTSNPAKKFGKNILLHFLMKSITKVEKKQ